MTDDRSGPVKDSSKKPVGGPESGSWGAAALVLLGVLFVLAAAATVHSVIVTLL